MRRFIVCLFVLVSNSIAFADDDSAPWAVDKRLKIELFAESPQIVTPTGIDVDLKGRVWAIESNTHFPPEGYKGHPTDRILVMSDTNGDGKADRIVEFADGLTHTMSIAVRPSGDVYVATRREIFIFNDDNGDDVADRKKRIVHLDTKGNYPHNGLAGFAFDAMTWTFESITSNRRGTDSGEGEAPAEPKIKSKKARQEPRSPGMLGWMYFGFGENLGADYKVIGSDGTTLTGGGEGGNIYRCRLDGSELKRWATGFWNPHASCIDAFGRLFTVDNDPDSLPPCRLLHIIEGGDYGYRYRNGRKGMHPFTAWNGEIPGTLPMISGTGEAPSGIVAYESGGFPEDYNGNLLVGSWGDHRIDRFRLKQTGPSFASIPEPIIQGGENFRPVGLAVAPDGSLYCTDWVLRDYKLHQHGRVWKVSSIKTHKSDNVEQIDASLTPKELTSLLSSRRIETRRRAASALAQSQPGQTVLLKLLSDGSSLFSSDFPPIRRIEALWALARVPTSVQDFDFTRKRGGPIRFGNDSDAIAVAAFSLFGTPQFTFDRKTETLGSLESQKRNPFAIFRIITAKTDLTQPYYSSRQAPGFLSPAVGEFVVDPNPPSFSNQFEPNIHNPYVFAAALSSGAKSKITRRKLLELVETKDERGSFLFEPIGTPRHRLLYLLIARRKFPKFRDAIEAGLSDDAPTVRRAAVQWAAEERFQELRPQIEAVLDSQPMTTDFLLAAIATLEMLDGTTPADIDKTPASKYVLPIVRDSKRTASVRAQALRLVEPNEPGLDGKLMRELVASSDPALRLEAVRTLQMSPIPEAGQLLASVANDNTLGTNLRSEAIVGMARVAAGTESDMAVRKNLVKLLEAGDAVVRTEAIRALRAAAAVDADARNALMTQANNLQFISLVSPPVREWAAQLGLALKQLDHPKLEWVNLYRWDRPKSFDGWMSLLGSPKAKTKPDHAAGRRAFFHVHGAGCYKCHTINGRGGRIGPDLSNVGRMLNRKRLVESILEPSKEIAPQFTAWTFVSEDGKVHTGMIVEENKGDLLIGDSKGTITELKTIDIIDRVPQKKSLMPDKLIDRMTVGEFRNLLAFLETLK